MLSFKEKGTAIAIIKGGSKSGEILAIGDNKGFEKIEIPYTDAGIYEIIPTVRYSSRKIVPYRDVMLIVGPSGVGKSTECAKYARKFQHLFPDKPVYMFSRKTEDPAFEGVELSRVRIDEGLVEKPIDIQSDEIEKNSLFIFDDYDTIPDENVQKAVTKLVMDILETGRSKLLYCVLTSHLLRKRNRNENDVVYNEIHRLMIPTQCGNLKMLKTTLENHFGLSGVQLKKIWKLKTRWVIFGKEYPQYILYDRGAMLLSSL